MSTITKSTLSRLAFARLRQIAPNETFAAEDQATAELEIDLCKARLESSIFGGVTLWVNDNAIPIGIVEGFIQCLLHPLASHYQGVTVPLDFLDAGFQELCRQLSRPYNPATINDEDEESESVLILDGVAATGLSDVQTDLDPPITFQMWIGGTSGSVSAAVKLWGSNDVTCLTSQANAAKTLLYTSVALSGTGSGDGIAVATETYVANTHYAYYWAEITTISGTGTAVTVTAVTA